VLACYFCVGGGPNVLTCGCGGCDAAGRGRAPKLMVIPFAGFVVSNASSIVAASTTTSLVTSISIVFLRL